MQKRPFLTHSLFFWILLTTTFIIADSNFKIYGHLTQGYAISSNYQVYGIPTDGTSDYRNLALQFRFDVDEYNSFVVQLNHKRLGLNPTMTTTENVELDWGFFERRFENGLNLRFGKVQMPLGIYNELRDVGILLPFYRTPSAVYLESRISAEAINGITLNYELSLSNTWILSSEVYFGQWDWQEWAVYPNLLQSGEIDLYTQRVEIKGAIGGQFWLNTPIEGLRLGISGYTGSQEDAFSFEELGGVDDPRIYYSMLSLDSEFEKVAFKSEISRFDFGNTDLSILSGYALGSLKISEKVTTHLQYEHLNLSNIFVNADYQSILGITKVDNKNFIQDFGFGLNYFFSSDVVAKVEYHYLKSLFLEDRFVNPYSGITEQTDYVIFSVSTSF